jgi:hypothetical protein
MQSLNSTLRRLYQVVMNPEVSSLRYLPVQQRMQVMVALGTMWTLIFTVSTGAWLYFGYLLAAHMLIPAGVLITGITFRFAEGREHARRKV